MSERTGHSQVFRGTLTSPGECHTLQVCLGVQLGHFQESPRCLEGAHVDMGLGNLNVVGYADMALHGIFRNVGEEARLKVCGNTHRLSSPNASRRAKVRVIVPKRSAPFISPVAKHRNCL